jgi:hypothetical protein
MKQLEHIRLVQFYLMEREDIAIDWVTGLFGPNGSGKSSVLDAVQIALVGGNANYAALNAQADDQSGPRGARTIRQYCLGQYGVEEGNIVRDSAVTYITLVWRDTETREPLSMGVCIAAQANRDGHEVLGRYLLPGIELAMSDHLETIDGEERPREWAAFRHQLQERARVSGQDSLFADSDRFMNAYLFALRGSGGKPAADAFRRAFRFAMRMRFDKSVDEIVRYQVLESRPIEIQKFKEVMESFRKLAELVAQVEQKIAGAEVVDKEFARAAAEARRAASWSALAADVKVEAANAGHDAAMLAAESATELLAGITSDIATTASDLEHAQNETQRVKQLRERHAAHAQHGLAQSQIAEKTGLATRSEQELTRELGYLTRVMRDAADSKLVPQATLELRAAAEPVAQWNAAARPEDRTRDGLRALLKPALSIVAQALNELFHTRTDLSRRTDVAKQDVASLEENLRRIAEGRAPLTENVQRLMSALRDQGLSPTPLCDVVRITDGEWQPAIEAYLGPHLQALLVPGEQEKRAFVIYRGLPGVYGAKIVIESHHRESRPTTVGSVAELIEGTVPAAVAYLRAQLGDTRRADGEEALDSRRALTRDGMLVRGGAMERLKLVQPQDFRLGARGSREQRDTLKRRLGERQRDLVALHAEAERARMLFERLQIVATQETVLQRFLASFDALQAANADVHTLRQALSAAADEEYVRLGEQERECNDRVSALTRRGTELAEAKGVATEALRQRTLAVTAAATAAAAAQDGSRQARSHAEFDADVASKQWDILLQRTNGETDTMQEACDQQVRSAQRACTTAIQNGTARLGEFVSQYREHLPPEAQPGQDPEAWRKAAVWVTELLVRLRNTDLQNYKREMQEAYETSRTTFRNDVALKLYESLERLDDHMAALNEVLRTCPVFSNGERYAFHRKTRPQYQALLRFIKDVGTHGLGGDLLGDQQQLPEEFRALLEDTTVAGAAGTKTPLDDYREFFEFDIEILREDPMTRIPKHLTLLSKRLGPSSGGEHRAPVYVIAGAALASAYRMAKGATGGIRLIVLDEAFDKMDSTNIIATMRYLDDLGLQVLLAGPGANMPILDPFLHRYYEIARDAQLQAMQFSGHTVTEAARALLRSDLFEFAPELLHDELTAMARPTPAGVARASA